MQAKWKAKMSEEQDITVETEVDAPESVEDVKVENVQNDEPELKEDENSQDEGEAEEEQPKTVEEKLADFEAKYEEKTRAIEAMQKKIDRQTAAYNAAQRAIQERDARLNEIMKSNAPEEKEPVVDDYETYDEYTNALADFKAKKILKEQEQKALVEKRTEEYNKLLAERASYVSGQEIEYIKENPRYEASKKEFDNFVKSAGIPQEVENAIVEAAFLGNVPQVIDYFGANNGEKLDEFEKISKLNPIQAAIEIYKIQQKLSSKPAAKKVEPLPRPVNAPKGGKSANKSLDDMSYEELKKRMGKK